MRRRAFLRTAAGTAAGTATFGAYGPASAHETPTDDGTGTSTNDGTGTPPQTAVGDEGPLGSVTLPDAHEAVVGADGTTAYVATGDGFATIDVSDPGDPTVLARRTDLLADREDGPLTGIQDLTVEGDRLLVVGPAHPIEDTLRAAAVFDVSDPSDPTLVGVHETAYPIHNCYLADGVAYLTGNGAEGNPLVTVEVGEEPIELGRWSLFDRDDAWREVAPSLRVLHDVWVQDDLAYLAHWDAGTYVVDVSDPADPAFVSRVRGRPVAALATIERPQAVQREATEPPGNDHYATLDDDGDLLAIGAEAWDMDGDGSGGPGGIELYDVSDPTEPRRLSRIEPPSTSAPAVDGVWTTSHNFELTGGHLYSSWYQGGVKVFDVSEPGRPRERYHWRDGSRTKFWTARLAHSGEFFVASSMALPGEDTTGGLYTFPDVERATPTQTPTPTSTSTPTSAPRDRSAGRRDTSLGRVGIGAGVLAALAALGLHRWRDRR